MWGAQLLAEVGGGCQVITLRIGQNEGSCLLLMMRGGQPSPRPCAYDSWREFMLATGSTVKRTVITRCEVIPSLRVLPEGRR